MQVESFRAYYLENYLSVRVFVSLASISSNRHDRQRTRRYEACHSYSVILQVPSTPRSPPYSCNPHADPSLAQLPGIPRLESARLLHVDGPLALLPGDGSAASASSAAASRRGSPPTAFFYNPFDRSAGDADGGGSGGDAGAGGVGSRGGGSGNEGGRRGKAGTSSRGAGGGGGGSGSGGRRRGGRGYGAGEVELPARWAAGETGRVVARLSNPLRVALEVTSMKAVLEGGKVQAFPTTVLLPPKAEFHEVRWFICKEAS